MNVDDETPNRTVRRRICVFCGSSPGLRSSYADAARALAEALVRSNYGLVYGGGCVGLMGILADRVLELGGDVVGVIPQSLVDLEVGHQGLSDLRVVGSMHERKALMAELSDAFVALPGGFGTLDETFEILTWVQLGFQSKPCGLLNVDGYFDSLLTFLDVAVRERFLHPKHRDLLQVATDPKGLVDELMATTPDRLDKWVDRARLTRT